MISLSSNSGAPVWSWLNEGDGNFVKYDEETTKILESAYHKSPDKILILTHGYFGQTPGGFSIDFLYMTQTQVVSGFVRHIRRKVK
jgi:hypothetical protein